LLLVAVIGWSGLATTFTSLKSRGTLGKIVLAATPTASRMPSGSSAIVLPRNPPISIPAPSVATPIASIVGVDEPASQAIAIARPVSATTAGFTPRTPLAGGSAGRVGAGA
jgi:hypothetical protein